MFQNITMIILTNNNSCDNVKKIIDFWSEGK